MNMLKSVNLHKQCKVNTGASFSGQFEFDAFEARTRQFEARTRQSPPPPSPSDAAHANTARSDQAVSLFFLCVGTVPEQVYCMSCIYHNDQSHSLFSTGH